MKNKLIIVAIVLLYGCALLMVILNSKTQNEIHNCAIHKFNTENLKIKFPFEYYLSECKEGK